MFENAITDVQRLEQSVAGKSLCDLQIRLALRSCLKELRALTMEPVDFEARRYPAGVTAVTLDGLVSPGQ